MQLLTVNECGSNPCRNGGTCVDQYNGFLCQCIAGWQGALCEQDVNECSTLAGTDLGCQNGATCINNAGSFRSCLLYLYNLSPLSTFLFDAPLTYSKNVVFIGFYFLAGLRKLFNRFSQNSVERWNMGCRKNLQILVVIRITLRLG